MAVAMRTYICVIDVDVLSILVVFVLFVAVLSVVTRVRSVDDVRWVISRIFFV